MLSPPSKRRKNWKKGFCELMTSRRWIFLGVACLFLLLLDAWSKWYTSHFIAPIRWYDASYPYGGIPVFQNIGGVDFSLNYVRNTGAAWGMFSGHSFLLLLLRAAILIGLIVFFVCAKLSFLKRTAFAFIVTGALGNIVDYFAYGHVVDMFHFVFFGYSFPVFNVADSLIFCGVVLLFWLSFYQEKAGKR